MNEINKELADSTLRCLEFEDKAKLERELRRKFEHEMDKLQDKLEAYSSSDDSSISEVSETRNGDDSSNSNNNGDNEDGVPSEKRQLTKKSGVSDEARQKQKQKNRPSPRRSERKKKKLNQMMRRISLLQHTCKERFNIWKSMARQKTMEMIMALAYQLQKEE